MAGLIVRIAILANAAKAKLELQGVAGAAEKISGKFAKFRAPAAAALGAIALGSGKAISAASDLNETISKADTIFGSNAAAMQQWSDGAAKNLGISKSQALDAAAGFGDMFSQLGLGGDAAADMSKEVVQLSADLGSFNNLETSDVADRMSAAFRGEYDSLQAVIPNINAARVEQEALAATHKKSAKDLTAAEKAQAVLAIVQKDGARAAGDFAKTQDGAANKTKIAQAMAADLSAQFGQKLLPAYTQVLSAGVKVLEFLGQHQGAVTVAVAAIGLLSVTLLGLSAASAIYNGAMAAVKIATTIATAAQWLWNAALTANPIGIIVVGIALLVAGLIYAWKNSETFRNVVIGAFNAIKAVGAAVWNWLKSAASAVWSFVTTYVRTQVRIILAVITGIKTVAVAVWNAIRSAAARVWALITAAVRVQVAAVRAVINGVKAVAAAVWNYVRSKAVAAFSGVKSTVTGAINGAKSKIGEIRTKASEVLSRIKALFSPSALYRAGVQLIQGLADGVAAKISAVIEKVRAAVAKIKAMLPGSPIKEGPLKSWNNGGAGKRLMGLLASGIAAGAPAVERQLGNVLESIANPTVTPSLALGGIDGIDLGGRGSQTVQQITVEVKVDRSMSPAEVGRQIKTALDAYARAGGR